MKKICYCFLLIIFILLTVGNFCFARELEVKILGISGTTDIIQYRNVLFNFLVGLGGALAILSLTIGAIQLIASAGNPESQGDAKKRIIGSVLGLILLFSSYLIMKTINPELTSLRQITELPLPYGIFLVAGEKEISCPSSVNDTSELLSNGFNKIVYKCGNLNPDKKPILWVREFPKTDLGDWANGTVVEMKCDSPPIIIGDDIKSFMLDIKRPGLYLSFSQKDLSKQILSSQMEIDEPYKGNTHFFYILSDKDKEICYGALFHTEINFEGKCVIGYVDQIAVWYKLSSDFLASSVEFFRWNCDPDNWKISGDGVDFYSRPFGWTLGANDAGVYHLSASDIKNEKLIKPGDLEFSFAGVPGATEEDIKKCKTFFDCPGSIRIKGDYLVIFAVEAELPKKADYCQTFYSSDKVIAPNLENSWFLKGQYGKFNQIRILPLK